MTKAPPGDAAAEIERAPDKVFVTGAGRCGECHEAMYDEWETTAHAKAASSPLYVAAIALAPDARCGARCHTPLAARIGDAGVASEGVTCDVCHTLRDPKPSPKGAEFRLAIDDMVKFGPRCDLKDHYFHRMGCSPEHQQSVICGSCHYYERDNGIPVFTEYKDVVGDKPCQGCHMPKERGPIAVGSPVREGVPHHGWRGRPKALLRDRAIALSVEATSAGIAVAITNVGGGHHLPGGLPERRLHVQARIFDAAKQPVATHDWWLGRVLSDDAGAFAPFWLATKVAADTRIAAGATWRATWEAAPAGATLEVEVRNVTAPELVTLLGAPGDDEHLAHVSFAIARLPAKKAFAPKGGRPP